MATFSEAYRESLASAPTDEELLDTIQIKHPDITDLYLVHAPADLTLTLETGTDQLFTALPFRYDFPDTTEYGKPSANLSIDAVDLSIIRLVQSVAQSDTDPTVVFRPYSSLDTTRPLLDPPVELRVSEVSIDQFSVNTQLKYREFVNVAFPGNKYSINDYEGLRV